MLKITERDTIVNHKPNKILRFEWDTGYLEILESKWNKLSKKKQNLIYEMGVNK